jgi:serine/threonine protein kinase
LGVGGMAEAYEAVRSGPSGFSQRVCLKLVLPFFRDNQEFIKLFEREARLSAKLRHSNIVGVIDFGEFQGTPYMALELVDGVDLRTLLDAQEGDKLPYEYVPSLGLELAAALDHAHSPPAGAEIDDSKSDVMGIVHRDISPSNVLVSRNGEIMLTDFGVARAMTGASRKQSAVKGKVPYMSPEHLRNELLDGRADLFSLGVVLYESLAGIRPYEGGHDPATIMLILKGDHQPLCDLAPEAPPEFCQIIESLIEPDREDRPANAGVLMEQLDDFAQSLRVRRKLGQMAGELRDEQRERSSMATPSFVQAQTAVQAADDAAKEAAETEESWKYSVVRPSEVSAGKPIAGQVGQMPGPQGPARRSKGRKAALFLTGLLIAGGILAGGIGGALYLKSRSDASVPAASGTAPSSETKVAEETPPGQPAATVGDEQEVAGPVPTTEGESLAQPEATKPPPEKPKPVVPRKATLTVKVFPWGNVWVNDKPMGRAPLANRKMAPGRYKISVGRQKPEKTRTVKLRPGGHEVMDFDLSQ